MRLRTQCTLGLFVTCSSIVQGCKWGGGFSPPPPPPDFKLMLCVQAVTTKRMSKILKNKDRKREEKQLSGYKHTKSKLRSVQIYEFGSRYVQQTQSQRLSPLLKSCLRPSSAVTIGDVNKVIVIAITCLCGAIGTKVHT